MHRGRVEIQKKKKKEIKKKIYLEGPCWFGRTYFTPRSPSEKFVFIKIGRKKN
jgi:hypothetical protein